MSCERVAGAVVSRYSLDSVAAARRRQDLLFGEPCGRMCSLRRRVFALFLGSVVTAVVAAVLMSHLLNKAAGIGGYGQTGKLFCSSGKMCRNTASDADFQHDAAELSPLRRTRL